MFIHLNRNCVNWTCMIDVAFLCRRIQCSSISIVHANALSVISQYRSYGANKSPACGTMNIGSEPKSLHSENLSNTANSTVCNDTTPIMCPHLFLLKKPMKTNGKDISFIKFGKLVNLVSIEQECEFCGECRCIVGSPSDPDDHPYDGCPYDDQKPHSTLSKAFHEGIDCSTQSMSSHLLFQNIYPSRCLRPCHRGKPIPVVSELSPSTTAADNSDGDNGDGKGACVSHPNDRINKMRIHETIDKSVGDIPKPWLLSIFFKTLNQFTGDPNNPYEYQFRPPCSPLRYTPNPPLTVQDQKKGETNVQQGSLGNEGSNLQDGTVVTNIQEDGSPQGVKGDGADYVQEELTGQQMSKRRLFPSFYSTSKIMKNKVDDTKSKNADSDSSTQLQHSVESHFAPVSPFIPIGQWGDIIKYGIAQPYKVLALNESIGSVTREALQGNAGVCSPLTSQKGYRVEDHYGQENSDFVNSGLSQQESVIALDALRYSAAAYGVPYEIGCFDDVKQVAIVRSVYDVYCASFESHFSATLRMLSWRSTDVSIPIADSVSTEEVLNNAEASKITVGVSPVVDNEIIMAKWSNYPLTPSFVLSVDHYQKRLVLTFRGTLNDFNTIANLMNEPIICGREYFTTGVRGDAVNTEKKLECNNTCEDDIKGSQKGYSASSRRRILTSPRGFCAPVLPYSRNGCYITKMLDEVLRETMTVTYPDYRLVVTGHSLGASLAQLYVMLRTPAGRYITGNIADDTKDAHYPSFSIFQSNEDASCDQPSINDDFLFGTYEMAKRVEVHAFAPPPCVNKVWRDTFAGDLDGSCRVSFPPVSCSIKMYSYVFEDDVVCRLQASALRHYITALKSNLDDIVALNKDKVEAVVRVSEAENIQEMSPLVTGDLSSITSNVTCRQKDSHSNIYGGQTTVEGANDTQPGTSSRLSSTTDDSKEKGPLGCDDDTTAASASTAPYYGLSRYFPFSYLSSLLSPYNGTEPLRLITSSWFNIDDLINMRRGASVDAVDKKKYQQLVNNVCNDARIQMEYGLLSTAEMAERSRTQADEQPTDVNVTIGNTKSSVHKEKAANADSFYVIPGRVFLLSSTSSMKLSATKKVNKTLGCPTTHTARGDVGLPLHIIKEIHCNADTLLIPRLDSKGIEDHFLFRYSSVLLQQLGLRTD